MRIERMPRADGEQIAAALTERHDLEGTFVLIKRHDAEDRYTISPVADDQGDFRAMVGMDKERGRITLLLDGAEAIVMHGATSAPL